MSVTSDLALNGTTSGRLMKCFSPHFLIFISLSRTDASDFSMVFDTIIGKDCFPFRAYYKRNTIGMENIVLQGLSLWIPGFHFGILWTTLIASAFSNG